LRPTCASVTGGGAPWVITPGPGAVWMRAVPAMVTPSPWYRRALLRRPGRADRGDAPRPRRGEALDLREPLPARAPWVITPGPGAVWMRAVPAMVTPSPWCGRVPRTGAGTRRRSAIPGNATAPRGRRDHGRYCSHPDRSRSSASPRRGRGASPRSARPGRRRRARRCGPRPARLWISENRFLHALNFCTLLPGPEAQQLATYVGWLMHEEQAGDEADVAVERIDPTQRHDGEDAR
jgi:hypothetical protein